MIHTIEVAYNAVLEKPDNVESWVRVPKLVTLGKMVLSNWKWQEIGDLHQRLKKYSLAETPAYSTFRPNRISPGTSPDFVWLEVNGSTVKCCIGDIDDCPIFEAIWGQKTVLVPHGWARAVSQLYREGNIRELRRDGRAVIIGGQIAAFILPPTNLRLAA